MSGRGGRAAWALGTLLAAALLAAPSALAHASLVGTDPPFLGGLPQAPAEVRLHFSEPLQPGQVYVGIFDEALLRRDLGNGNLSLDPADARVLVIPTGHLTRGAYTISFEATSAQDGHAETGSLAMSIGVPCPACTATAPPGWGSLQAASALLRLGVLAGVAALLGEASLQVLLRRPPRPAWPRRLGLAGAAAAGLAALAAPAPWTWLGAAVSLAAAAAVVASRRPGPWAAVGLATLALGLALQGGHDVGQASWLPLVHAAPLLAWAGSLPGLASWLRQGGDLDGVRRYSRAATANVVLLAGTATLLAVRRLGEAGLDWGHPYVQALAAKTALVAVLLGAALLNHRATWRAGTLPPAGPGRVARRVQAEAVLGALVLVATAVLASLPPPVAASTGTYRAERWHGDTRVGLAISPAGPDGSLLPGDHLHSVRLWDVQGEPITDASVSLRFRHALLDVGSLETTAHLRGTAYEDEGTYLGALGPWEVEVLFRLPGTDPTLPDQRVLFPVQLGNVTHVHGGASIRDPHFDTGYLNPNGSYTIVFGADKEGTYQVHCHPHPWMQMRLTVTSNASLAPQAGSVTVRILGNATDPATAMRFDPAQLVVAPGTSVRFVNEGDLPHTATNVRWTPPP